MLSVNAAPRGAACEGSLLCLDAHCTMLAGQGAWCMAHTMVVVCATFLIESGLVLTHDTSRVQDGRPGT